MPEGLQEPDVDASGNRQRILSAVQEVMIERGIDLDVREIASRAGVGLGTIYRTFASKEVILRTLLDRMADEFDEVVDRACEVTDPRQSLVTFTEGFWAFGDRYGRSYDLRKSAVADHSYASRALAAWNRVEGIVQDAIDAGIIDEVFDPVFVISAMIGLASDFCADPWSEGNEPTHPATHERMTRLLLNGLRRA